MKGTRLYQRAHSPLIEGRSRRERPLSYEWASGLALALGVTVALYALTQSAPLSLMGDAAFWKATIAPVLVGAALGAWLGALLARQMGWRPPWTTGAITALVLEAVFYAAGAAFLR